MSAVLFAVALTKAEPLNLTPKPSAGNAEFCKRLEPMPEAAEEPVRVPTPAAATVVASTAAAPDLATAERSTLRKAGLLLVILLGLVAVVYLTPLRAWVSDLAWLSAELRALGWLAPAVFVLGTAVLVTVGVPRLLLCPLAGMVFGFWGGLLLSQIGTLIGYYLLFLFVRWGGRGFVLRHKPQLSRFADLIGRQGVPAVILARQLPIHGWLVNLVLSLTPVRHRHFLLGTAIGLLPEAIPCTLIGAGAFSGSLAHSVGFLVLAVVGLALVWIAFAVYVERQKGKGAGGGNPSGTAACK